MPFFEQRLQPLPSAFLSFEEEGEIEQKSTETATLRRSASFSGYVPFTLLNGHDGQNCSAVVDMSPQVACSQMPGHNGQRAGLVMEDIMPERHLDNDAFGMESSPVSFGPNRSLHGDDSPACMSPRRNLQSDDEFAVNDRWSEANLEVEELDFHVWPCTDPEAEYGAPGSWQWPDTDEDAALDATSPWTKDSSHFGHVIDLNEEREPVANCCLSSDVWEEPVGPVSGDTPALQQTCSGVSQQQGWSDAVEEACSKPSDLSRVGRVNLSLEAALPQPAAAAQAQAAFRHTWQVPSTHILCTSPAEAGQVRLPDAALKSSPETPTCSTTASIMSSWQLTPQSSRSTSSAMGAFPIRAVPDISLADDDSSLADDETDRIKGASFPVCKTADAPLTTVMIRNLPKTLNQRQLLQELNVSGFCGLYDFCYLPSSFVSKDSKGSESKGYAFVNFTRPEAASRFKDSWHGRDFPPTAQSGMRHLELAVSPAEVQGLEANLKKWSGRIARIRNPDLKPFILSNTLELASLGVKEEVKVPMHDEDRSRPKAQLSVALLATLLCHEKQAGSSQMKPGPVPSMAAASAKERDSSAVLASQFKSTGSLAVQKARALLPATSLKPTLEASTTAALQASPKAVGVIDAVPPRDVSVRKSSQALPDSSIAKKLPNLLGSRPMTGKKAVPKDKPPQPAGLIVQVGL
eukprot:TRINITY_DN5045_c0_g2_i1.p1 TRINITY_DN5045_c0_g2~~TRINITY_DN5045_c0_g2_i1.p1  ORF type:complete len:690 (+),score=160.57 TRINITY_DN5045_c0_g2_i1:100-2169(+)